MSWDFTYQQGGFASPEAAAETFDNLAQTSDDFFGPEAKVKAAKNKLEHAHGPQVALAQQQLKDAKAKLKKAKAKYKKACHADGRAAAVRWKQSVCSPATQA